MHFTPDGHGSYEYKPDGSNYDKRQAAAARTIAAPLCFALPKLPNSATARTSTTR